MLGDASGVAIGVYTRAVQPVSLAIVITGTSQQLNHLCNFQAPTSTEPSQAASYLHHIQHCRRLYCSHKNSCGELRHGSAQALPGLLTRGDTHGVLPCGHLAVWNCDGTLVHSFIMILSDGSFDDLDSSGGFPGIIHIMRPTTDGYPCGFSCAPSRCGHLQLYQPPRASRATLLDTPC